MAKSDEHRSRLLNQAVVAQPRPRPTVAEQERDLTSGAGGRLVQVFLRARRSVGPGSEPEDRCGLAPSRAQTYFRSHWLRLPETGNSVTVFPDADAAAGPAIAVDHGESSSLLAVAAVEAGRGRA